MRVASLELSNVRQFGHKRLAFNPGFNLLVGENGAGKSTVLRSLLTALGHAGNFRSADRLTDDDIRYRSGEFRIKVECEIGESTRTIEIQRRWRQPTKRTGHIAREAILWFGPNESLARPLQGEKARHFRGSRNEKRFRDEISMREEFLYHEEFMEHPDDEEKSTFGRSEHVRRFVGRVLSSFSPKFERFTWRFVPYDCSVQIPESVKTDSRQKEKFCEEVRAEFMRFIEYDFPPRRYFRGWGSRRLLTFNSDGQPLEGDKRIRPLHEIREFLENAARRTEFGTKAISGLKVQIKLAPRIYVFGHEGPFLISQLSDGEKRIFSMIVDIARQLSLVGGSWKNLESATGLVVIDEIDCHLHPKWQRMIVKELEGLFPSCQFIATTHSPFVVQAVEAHQLQSLGSDPLPDFENRGIEEIAFKVMRIEDPEVNLRYLELLKVAREYYGILEQAKGAVGSRQQELKDQLRKLSDRYARNPAFQAYLEMKRQGSLGPDSL